MHAEYAAGLSIGEVAQKYGKHRQNVHDAFRRRGLPRRGRVEAVRARAARFRAARVRVEPVRKRIVTEREAFECRVERRGPGECWPWRGTINTNLYGLFVFGGTRRGAHRVALEMSGVFIPEGRMACHHCDNPPCCNPAHLYVGTARDNAQDARRRGRIRVLTGERHPFSRLTVERVLSVRAAAGADESTPRMVLFARLAKEHGVALTTIQSVVNRGTWRHV